MDNVNDLLDFQHYVDKDDAIEQVGDKVFADADTSGLWGVYEKTGSIHNSFTFIA